MIGTNEDSVTAVEEFAAAVGPAHVITDTGALHAAEISTFRTTFRIPAIVCPANRQEVQECLRIANRLRVPVYPISSGKNWGYGSRVPAADRCVLLDLRRMDRIIEYDEKLAYVTVEPGVTQAQLYAFLQERNSSLWMDASGASPECSLIGNALERGFGHTPYDDHFAHSCGLEVVLPNGEIIETGFARFPGARAAATYRAGVGPLLDGIFSQSNLGIVTRMTIWLMPAPEYFQAYFFRCEHDHGVSELIDALRPLRLGNVIRGASHIANDYKVLSGLRQYPWQETGGRTPLQGGLMDQFRRELKIGAWNGSGALYGTRGQVREARRLLRRALGGKASKLQFLDDRALAVASTFAKPYRWLTGWNLERLLAMLQPVYGLMKGIPTSHPLASTYWRKRIAPPLDPDPDRDGCGLLWCSPVTPMDGAATEDLTRLASSVLLEHGFEPQISLTLVTDRSVACVVSIAFDRDVPGEDGRALACYHDLLKKLAAAGFYSYRLSTASMDAVSQPGGYNNCLHLLKAALDRNNILAPGRYLSSNLNPVEGK